jgi:sialidase-1
VPDTVYSTSCCSIIIVDLVLTRAMVGVGSTDGYGYAPQPGAILQVRSTDKGFTWSEPVDISKQLGSLMSPDPHNLTERSVTTLAVGPGAGIQLSSTNKFHPNRIMWSGTHDGYGYDCIWYSDDGGKTYQLAKDATTGKPAQLWGMSESALAETPDGGVIISMRNEGYHRAYPATECLEDSDCEGSNNTCIANHQGRPAKTCKHEPPKVNCNCRGTARSTDGGTSFSRVEPAPALLGPVCQATMVSVANGPSGAGRTIFHANPGHGTDSESKSPPNGRASGTVRRSVDGGRNWEASVDINGHEGYSYSCLTEVPEPGFVGVAYETVLPGSSIRGIASANNIVFTLVPQNFSNSSYDKPTIPDDGEV